MKKKPSTRDTELYIWNVHFANNIVYLTEEDVTAYLIAINYDEN
jgi:hypothetical protein